MAEFSLTAAEPNPLPFTDPEPLVKRLADAWVISDTHFFHDNVVEYCSRPADHDMLMVLNWRDAVGPNDLVLHCGDVAVGSIL